MAIGYKGNGEYQLEEDIYFEVTKMLDSWSGVKKETEGDFLVYSRAEPNPDLKVRAIIKGNIQIDNFRRIIKTSADIELAEGLESKLKVLISGL